ncbi:MAG: hypothetical protein IKO27_04550 [Ruminococcus sp.]|nr:hypothetical protein [Ruminococcus sp.]
MGDEKRERALDMLRAAYERLGRLPGRKDFTPEEVCFIKQKLGPFPRALEQAGLKPVTGMPAAVKSRIKRERSRRRRKLAKQQGSEEEV